ncbi:MAG TPA: hypothetical protein PK339_03220 [Flavitalea sp.]|nr:hypothetical protein [Flavitalea sp.]
MKLASMNQNRVLRQVLPSVFFITCIALYLIGIKSLAVNCIAIGIALLILGNIFWQNMLISRIFGAIFLLGSFFMLLAISSDFANGKAASGYWVGVLLLLLSIAMSVLLMLGYEKKNAIVLRHDDAN